MSTEAARALFADTFGSEPQVITSAPGRVNLIGEHTDYNGGQVLPIAIARRTYVAAARTARARSRVVSATENGRGEFDPHEPRPAGAWWDYVAGVSALVTGAEDGAADLAVWSDVPAGAGLSSSAALEVASASALSLLAGGPSEPRALAELSHEAEVNFVGVPSGIMDQFAAALASRQHALQIFCDTATTRYVSFVEPVLVFDTGAPRELRGSAFATRRAECEEALRLLRRRCPSLQHLAHATPELLDEVRLPPPLDRRARHVVEETRRVGAFVDGLERTGRAVGELLVASHESLRQQYECSSAELDWFVDRAMWERGMFGARLTGAGWGGCAIALGEADVLADAAPRIATEYRAAFAIEPRYWLTNAEAGVRVERA